MREKSIQSLYFLAAIILLGVALTLTYSGFGLSNEVYGYWFFTYFIFALLIFEKLRRSIIDHPFVLVGSSYFLLLIVGSIAFEIFKDRPLNLLAFNLIAIGFSALMGAIVIGELIGPEPLNQRATRPVYNAGFAYVLAGLGVLASLVMFLKFKGVPILAADPNEAKVNFLSGNGLFNLFFKGMSVFALAILYERFYNGKSLMGAHIYCVVTVLITLAAGYRSSSIVSLGEYVALYFILTKIKMPVTRMAVIGILLILFLASWGAFRRGSGGTEELVREFDRVINGRPVIIEAILKNFKTDDFFNGSLYYSDFKRFQPGVQVNANVDLKYAIFPTAEDMPDSAGITPSIVGEAYMNFGEKGVFWVTLLVGFLLGYFYKCFKAKPNFFRTATFLTFIFGIADAVQTGIGLKLVHLAQFWVWVILLSIVFETEVAPRRKVLWYSH